jgi:outer membrane protein OmpA-like peptidoglycan-associated protein
MRVFRLVQCIVILGACGVLASGCGATRRGRSGGGVGGDDLLAPGTLDQLEGDFALGGRFDEAGRVQDVLFDNVQFAYDSFQITESEVVKIQHVADYMRRNPETRLVVEGHCDERGSREYNLSLGEHRALAVRAHLIMLGIDAGRIQTRSYGEEMPLDPLHTPEAYSINRRVEFALYR